MEKSLPYYVTTVGCNATQNGIYRKNGLPDYQFLICKKGAGRVILNGETKELTEGDILYTDKNTTHNYTNISTPWITDWITFNGVGVPFINKLKTGIYRFGNFDEITSVIEAIANTGYSFKWSKATSVLLYKLLLLCDDTESIKTSVKRLKPAIKYIEQNYNRDIQLSEISNTVNVTKEHLCSLFKSAYDMRPFQYVTKVRIEKAKELLYAYPDMPVSEISKICGFNSTAYFTLKFKELENITPTQFKNKN